ncbi:MAG: hypothetical protein JOZ24_13435 [Candidatus Eremiobacteraeota bacterium]|nr:hypothetical protein [Candidatus Eremiobacteraeota bacterium]
MRALLILLCAAGALALGGVQLASSAAYGDLATRPSLPAALHGAAPLLLRPLLGDARAQAEAAFHEGRLDAAASLLATLPPDAESADLRGRIDEARGDGDGALAAFVRARDLVRAQALIDALARRDAPRALREQQRMVAALATDVAASESAGQAWWRLGELHALTGYREPAHRAAQWRAAEAAYEQALRLAPNEETYLLAAGYQSLANGDAAASERFYARAAEVVPNGAEAAAGLAWTAAARGDCARARALLARARRLAPAAVRDPTNDPNVGDALRRCAT